MQEIRRNLMKSIGIIILAAGVGKRMRSKTPKVLHPICGRPMLSYVVDTAVSLSPAKTVVVVGSKMDSEILRHAQNDKKEQNDKREQNNREGQNDKKFKSSKVQANKTDPRLPNPESRILTPDYRKIEFVVQDPPRGTGDAVLCAEKIFKDFEGSILVLCGDVPLLKPITLDKLIEFHKSNKEVRPQGVATVLTTIVPEPASYGRVVKSKVKSQKSKIKRIVEATDADESIKKIDEINTGIYIFEKRGLFDALHKIKPSNVQGEYYFTDTIEILCNEGKEVYGFVTEDWQEVIGINTRKALSEVESILQAQIIERHQFGGVTIKNYTTTVIDFDVKIGADTVIHHGVQLLGTTQIGEDCEIGANTIIKNSVISSGTKIGDNSTIEDATI